MNLKDLGKLISKKELTKIKRKVGKMSNKEAEQELKEKIAQFKQLTDQIGDDEEKKDD